MKLIYAECGFMYAILWEAHFCLSKENNPTVLISFPTSPARDNSERCTQSLIVTILF